MTLQDSESVGQSQLRAVGPLGYSRPRGKASHWFPRSGPCCSLIGRELPSLLENVAGSQTSDVLCVRRKSHGGVRAPGTSGSYLKIGILQEQQRSHITHILLNIKTF